jgi:hypothetical protein
LLPRSGLELSDFVLWPNAEVPGCPLSRRYWWHNGHQTASAVYEYTPLEHSLKDLSCML